MNKGIECGATAARHLTAAVECGPRRHPVGGPHSAPHCTRAHNGREAARREQDR